MSGQTSLYDLANELLGACAAGMAATPSGAPAYQAVVVGPPAFDCCPSLYVSVISLAPHELPEVAPDMRQTRPSVPLATMQAYLLRCIPIVQGGLELTVPAPADLIASAQQVYRDGFTTYNLIRSRARSGTLFPSSPTRPVSVGSMMPVNPQGGCGGWMIPVTVELDGYTQP